MAEPAYPADWSGEGDCARFLGRDKVEKSCCGGRRVKIKYYVRCSMHGGNVPARVACRRDVCRSYLPRKAGDMRRR